MAVWVRPENALLCMMVLALMWISSELKWREAALLAALAVASEMTISHFGYGWHALCFHTFLGGEPGDIPRFTAIDYVHALGHGFSEALHSSATIYVLLGAVCFIHVRDRKWRTLLGVAALFSVTKFFLFPNYEPRYYGLYFIVVATAAMVSISQFVRTFRFSAPVGWK
jgi:Na+-transporting NADH:ubiquinone oxidoreductase subunit NqrB